MSTITIQYFDKSGTLICSYDTGDDFTPSEIHAWTDAMNDNACDHPGEPDAWDTFAIVETAAVCA